jgi:hypothetical protein
MPATSGTALSHAAIFPASGAGLSMPSAFFLPVTDLKFYANIFLALKTCFFLLPLLIAFVYSYCNSYFT